MEDRASQSVFILIRTFSLASALHSIHAEHYEKADLAEFRQMSSAYCWRAFTSSALDTLLVIHAGLHGEISNCPLLDLSGEPRGHQKQTSADEARNVHSSKRDPAMGKFSREVVFS